MNKIPLMLLLFLSLTDDFFLSYVTLSHQINKNTYDNMHFEKKGYPKSTQCIFHPISPAGGRVGQWVSDKKPLSYFHPMLRTN